MPGSFKRLTRLSNPSASRRILSKISLTLLLIAFFALPAFAQATGDSRTVTEPQFPTTICQTLQAQLQATNGVFQGYDETATGFSKPDTARVQAAINACTSTTGVSAVEFQADGTNNAFLIGPITFKSGVVLLIDPGVTLYGSRLGSDYGSGCGTTSGSCNPLIGGSAFTNAGIMGYGVIDGRGDKTLIGKTITWWDPSLENGARPRLINLATATNFTLYKITLQNSPKFHFYLQNTQTNGVTAWGIKIKAPYDSPNTDGFDPTGSNVTLTNSYISVGDDEVAIKGGSTVDSMTYSHNHFYSGHGMSIGSETNGGVNNVYVTDLALAGDRYDTNNYGLRIKSDSSRGGTVQNILYDGVCIKDTDHPLVFDTAYSSSTGTYYPYFKSITVRNTHIVDDPAFHYFSNVENVVFNGYSATYPMGMTLDNLVFDPLILAATTNNGTNKNRFYGQYVDFTFGPGPVNIDDQLPYISPGYYGGTITVDTVIPGNSNPPYDCTGKWTYLAAELFATTDTNTAGTNTVSINSGDSVSLKLILQPIVAGQISGTPSAPDPLPQGTVSILDNGTPFTTVPLSTTGWLTQFTLAGLNAGQHTITAHFPGDSVTAKYTAMDFGSIVVNVTGGSALDTTTALAANPSTVTFGDTVTLTATVTSSGTPTGTVNFFEGATLLGTDTLANGTATFQISTLSAGAHSITASYTGATGFNSSTSSSVSITVNAAAAATTTTLTANPNTPTSGQSVTLTATVASDGGTPTGTVGFYDGATLLGTRDLASGMASYSTSTLAVGAHSITATYAGNSSFTTSTSSTVTVTVSPAADFTITANPTTVNVAIGGTGTTTLTLTPANGFNGSVSLSCGNVPSYLSCTFSPQSPVTVAGTATPVTLTIHVASTIAGLQQNHSLPFGPFGIPAMFAFVPLILLPGRKRLPLRLLIGISLALLLFSWIGCGGGSGSTTTPPGPSSTTTVLVAAPATINQGNALTLTATVTSADGTPTGTVGFFEGTAQLGSSTLNASGVATYTNTSLTPGSHNLTAHYLGTANYSGSTSSASVVKVNPPIGNQSFTLSATSGSISHPLNVTVNITN